VSSLLSTNLFFRKTRKLIVQSIMRNKKKKKEKKTRKTTTLTRYYHPCCDSRVDLGFAHRRENPGSDLLEFVVTQPHLPTTAPIAAAAAATEESSHSLTLLTS
jgi:hypothetical protein